MSITCPGNRFAAIRGNQIRPRKGENSNTGTKSNQGGKGTMAKKRTTHLSSLAMFDVLQKCGMTRINANDALTAIETLTFEQLDCLYKAIGIIRRGEQPDQRKGDK